MSILIVGGTGRVGREVVLRLSNRNLTLNALVRGGRNHPGAKELLEAGVNIIEGDLRDPNSLKNAVQNVETVICTATSMPAPADDGLRQVDHDGVLSLIDAAEAQGVERFIYVSYSGQIRFDSPLERAKRACEGRLMQSRMDAIILRPSYFMEVWLSPMLGFDPVNGTARIYGSGQQKLSYISSSDVAAFAAATLAATPVDRNTILELGGPEPLSQLDAVRICETAIGRSMQLEYVPIEALQTQHQSSHPLQQSFAALMLSYANGDEIPTSVETASRYQIRLTSVAEYASRLVSQMSPA